MWGLVGGTAKRRLRPARRWVATLSATALAAGSAVALAPAAAAVEPPVSQATAQAISLDLLGAVDVELSNPATSVVNDGNDSNARETSNPTLGGLAGISLLAVGAAAEAAEANQDGSSYACAGVVSPAGGIQIGNSGSTCSASGSNSGGVTLDLGEISNVGTALNGLATISLTADSIVAFAHSDGTTAAGNATIAGLEAKVCLLGGSALDGLLGGLAGLLGSLTGSTDGAGEIGCATIPVTVPAGVNQDLLPAVIDALDDDVLLGSGGILGGALEGPLNGLLGGVLGGLFGGGTLSGGQLTGILTDVVGTLSDALAPVITLTSNHQTTEPDGTLKVAGLHLSVLDGAGGTGNLALATVGPNSAPIPTKPGVPAQLTATPGNEFVNLSWSAPTNTGGSLISGYNLYRGTSSGGEASTPINGTTLIPGLGYSDTGLTNGTTYYYIVKAVNAQGESMGSNEASATPGVGACVAPFNDVPDTSIFCPDIAKLKDLGITKGVTPTLYKPHKTMTRQAMAGFVYRMLNPGQADPTCTQKPFPDVKITNTFCGDITWLKAHDIGRGFGDGTFRPTTPMTRQAMAAFMYRLSNLGTTDPGCTAKPFSDVSVTNVFCGDITWLKGQGITYGYASGAFKPRMEISRAMMAAFVHRLID